MIEALLIIALIIIVVKVAIRISPRLGAGYIVNDILSVN
jgi:hypothetical protein